MSAPSPPTATIDGRAVSAGAGGTILSVAAQHGIDIPTLCHADALAPEGGCRLCLVEIEGQRPQAACHTPIAPGMIVRTTGDRLRHTRRSLLSLMRAALPADSVRPDPAGTRFQRLLAAYDVPMEVASSAPRPAMDESHPYMRFDRSKCITCRLCLNACEQIQGQFVYGIEGRGGAARLIYGPTDRFADSACVACGACVDVCPTGAITDRDRIPAGGARSDRAVDSVCGYCGVGCRGHVESANGIVLRVTGVRDAAVNRGHLCVKGRYAHAFHHSADRLTTPLLRNPGGGFRPASWSEAIAFAARRLLETRDRYGADALGTMTSSRSTNEAAYLLQRLFRSVIGTNNTDCCARVCHSSTAVALGMVTGTGAATASYADLEEAGLLVVAGANPTEAHPVVGARIRQAALRGAALIVIDPRRIELAEYADVHLPAWPGSNVVLFNALAKVLIEEELCARAYIDERCEGFDALRAFLHRQSLDELAAVTRVPPDLIRKAARIIGTRGPGLFISGLGLSEQTQGVAGVMAYCNLGLLTGSPGRRGAGMLPLRGQNNVQGNADMGAQPYALTGYMKPDDPQVQARLRMTWGTAPPAEPGMTIPEMYDAAVAGRLRALWIQGEDVAQSDPNTTHVLRALESLDLLIVQELFMTETARRAHVVFPAASVFEQDGTFTNGERRIQRVRAAVPPPGEARPDWEVIRDVARAMSGPDGRWAFAAPSDVMDELAQVAPHLFGGVSYARLGADGLQWPCPDADHPGTRTVHADGFVRGRALLMCVEYAPPQDATDGRHPYVLITGRVLDHYNVGTMTRRTPSAALVGQDALELHPEDAARLRIRDGERVRITSRWGEAVAPARLSRRMIPGTAFLSFHFPQTQTNRVVGPYTDPTSRCPDYKVVAVALSPAEPATRSRVLGGSSPVVIPTDDPRARRDP